jgi:hypothetical protein
MMVLMKSQRKLCRSAKEEFYVTFIQNPKTSSHIQKKLPIPPPPPPQEKELFRHLGPQTNLTIGYYYAWYQLHPLLIIHYLTCPLP